MIVYTVTDVYNHTSTYCPHTFCNSTEKPILYIIVNNPFNVPKKVLL